MSHALVALVTSGGLIAIFLTMALESAGVPIPSELVVPLGGALSSGTVGTNRLSFVGVVAAATVGNLMGSLVAFGLTKRYGDVVVLGPGRTVGLTPGHLALAHRVFDRWGLAAVFAGRMLPVVRTYISFPAGLARIRLLPFGIATICGAIPWNLALAFGGLKLGDNYEALSRALGHFTLPLAIVVFLAVAVGYYYGRRYEVSAVGRED